MKKNFDRTLYRVLARLSSRVNWKWLNDWKTLTGISLLAAGGTAAAGDSAPERHAARFPVQDEATLRETVADTSARPKTAADSIVRQEGVVFSKVEKEPIFTEGNVMAYLRTLVDYPSEALDSGVTGKVLVGFEVDETGKVVNVRTLQGLHPALDSYAESFVRRLPAFLPAEQGGKPVKVEGTVPVEYTADMREATRRSQNMYCYVEEQVAHTWDKLKYYICDSIRYPEEALEKGIKGNVYVEVTIRKDGSVTNERIVRGAHPLLDAEALRVVRELPRWEPAEIEGITVDETYVITVPFDPDYTEARPWGDVYVVVEDMPKFPHGDPVSYIQRHLRYPEEAKKDSIEGKVFVQFVIERNGSIFGAKVLRSVHPLLDAEALRVVRELPRWEPGRQWGKAVRVAYTLPVTFSLD